MGRELNNPLRLPLLDKLPRRFPKMLVRPFPEVPVPVPVPLPWPLAKLLNVFKILSNGLFPPEPPNPLLELGL